MVYSSLRVFGCKVLFLITGPTQGGKVSSKASECIHLYTLSDGDGWIVWDKQLRREVKTHDAVFYEREFTGLGSASKQTQSDWFSWSLDQQTRSSDPHNQAQIRALWERQLSASIHNPANQRGNTPSVPTESSTPETNIEDVNVDTPTKEPGIELHTKLSPLTTPIEPRRTGTRVRKQPDWYGSQATFTADEPTPQAMSTLTDPQSYKEAVSSPDRIEWMKATRSEIDSLTQHRVFDLVPLPKGKRAIGCRWTYKTKYIDGQFERLKARLVAKGFLQKKGVDFNETYAPSTRAETIRIVMSHMVRENWDSQQMDVMTDFLNSTLQEEVYLKQPEGFINAEHPTWVWRIRASLYGLRQAPREWNLMLAKKSSLTVSNKLHTTQSSSSNAKTDRSQV